MVPSNALTRTFRIKYGQSYGTCFTVDIDNRQYIVTAKHVANGISPSASIEIFHTNQWHRVDTSLVGEARGEIDVTVLAIPLQLSPTHPLPASDEDIYFGQDIYFLGFPYNLFTDLGEINRNFPIPFIKKGIVSSITSANDGVRRYFLDGHNNPGFSGGPVVFAPPGQQSYRVAAVISGYRYENEPIYAGDQATQLAYLYNTGIIIAYGIQHAVDLIHMNPIGFDLTSS